MGCVVKIRCEGKWLGQEMVAVAVGGGQMAWAGPGLIGSHGVCFRVLRNYLG